MGISILPASATLVHVLHRAVPVFRKTSGPSHNWGVQSNACQLNRKSFFKLVGGFFPACWFLYRTSYLCVRLKSLQWGGGEKDVPEVFRPYSSIQHRLAALTSAILAFFLKLLDNSVTRSCAFVRLLFAIFRNHLQSISTCEI